MSRVVPVEITPYGITSTGPEYCKVAVPSVNGVEGGKVYPEAG
jgi:hypothetical protein